MKGKCSGAFLSTFPPLLGWVGFPFYFLTHRLPAAWPICMGMVKKCWITVILLEGRERKARKKEHAMHFLVGTQGEVLGKCICLFLPFSTFPFFLTNIFNFPVWESGLWNHLSWVLVTWWNEASFNPRESKKEAKIAHLFPHVWDESWPPSEPSLLSTEPGTMWVVGISQC